jgi:16S rRNA (uracil1498-N3)-methyltransferase
MSMQNAPRLHIVNDLGPDQALTISGDQAHYLQNVMRLKVGDSVRLFNGRDGEWHGVLSEIAKRALTIKLQNQLKPQKSEPDLWLCCAPIKKAHFDYMIEKATELGVSTIKPVLTARTQIREVNVERCTSIAAEAAEQSERMNVPRVEKPMALSDLTASWPDDRQLIVCAEFGAAAPIHQALQAPALRGKKSAIIVGPEGGFAPEEFETLRAIKNALFVRLGPRILRADTAALSALTCWQAICGDWDTKEDS